MGAENSILQNCEWAESYQNDPWEIENGRLPNDDEISLFRQRPKDRQNDGYLRALTKQLRSLRHPYILHYVGFEENSTGPCLITEKAVPLEALLPKMSATEICAGLQNILEALEFLHDRAKICHNNLQLDSVYVSVDGSWRLGGLEHACLFTAVTQQLLTSSKNVRGEDTITPEELESKVVTDVEYGHARDVYAFAVMTESLLEKMGDLGDLTKTFELRIQDECLNKDPKLRPKVVSLLQDRLFSTEFLEIASFLKYVALKSEGERKEFFKSLLPKLRSLPEKLIGQRLVPCLLSRFVMLDHTATEYIMPSLLVPRSAEDTHEADGIEDCDRPLLDETVFKQYVIPRLIRIFAVPDYHVHITLLKYFKYFVHLIDPEPLELDVFPHVLLGLRDTSNDIAALSLHALAEMVPILGRDIIIGGQSKPFFKEGMPKEVETIAVQQMAGHHLNDQERECYRVEMIQKLTSHSPINNIKPNSHNKKGKVPLKDLAKFSEKHVDEAKDNKMKERERKREEMKKRREERKLARDKVKLKNQEFQSTKSEKVIPNLSNATTISSHSVNILESQKIHDQSDKDDSLYSTSLKEDENLSKEKSDEEIDTVSPDLSVQHSETESFSAEITDVKNEWDDWNDKGDHSYESDISDDIERELQNMESVSLTVNSKESSPKHSVRSSTSSKSALKLVTKKTKTKDKEEKEDQNAIIISELEKSVQNSFPTYNRSDDLSKTKIKAQHTSQPKDLGSEYDIKTIDIKVQETADDPFDFFADMAPKIESKNVSDILKDAGKNLDDDPVIDVKGSSQSTQISFDVQSATTEVVEDGGGWGDDDW